MCGFTGFIDFTNQNINYDNILKKCNSDISFRGPDDAQIYIDHENRIFLGFRRLSFLDLSNNSSQPMFSLSKKSIILFNGEIYNFKKLKDKILNNSNISSELLKSDSQVIVEYISLFGIEVFLNVFSGMMSLVYIDLLNKKIYLLVDHFGQKPLYYSLQKNCLYFSSDIRTIKNNEKFERKIISNSIDNYLFKNYISSPNTIYENIFKLNSSNLICYDFSNNNIEKKNDYLYYNKTNFDNSKNIKTSIHDTLSSSVEECLVSDVKLGCFLSSGIDSALIASIASKRLDYKLDSFTIGFNENSFDESSDAIEISKHLNIKNEVFILTDNDIKDTFEKIPSAYSEPFSDSSQLPYLFLSSKTSNFVKGVLTGDGGDELFGGYNRHLQGVWYFKIIKKYPFLVNILNSKYFKMLFKKNTSLLNKLLEKILKINYAGDKISRMINALNQNNIYNFYDILTSHCSYHNYSIIKPQLNYFQTDNNDLEKKMMLFDLNYFLPNDLMVKSDRASMFNGLEARSPFLNKNLFEESIGLSKEELFYNGIKKNPLKKLLSIYIPDKLISKKKKGFVVPIDSWLKGILKEYVFYYLSETKIKNSPLNKNYIKYILNSFYKENKGLQYELWDILIFQMWYEKYH